MRSLGAGKGDLMQSRKFFTPSNVALLIVAILAAAQMGCMGCASDTEDAVDVEAQSDTQDSVGTEAQLAPGYSHPQGFSYGH